MPSIPSVKATAIKFPRTQDGLGHAWGLQGEKPERPWERSPLYEERLEQLILALEPHGYAVQLNGAGGQDGEFITARHPSFTLLVQHLEDPSEDQAITALLGRLSE